MYIYIFYLYTHHLTIFIYIPYDDLFNDNKISNCIYGSK